MPYDDYTRLNFLDVEAWNDWRDKNLDYFPNLVGVDLRGKDFPHINLSKAHLSKSDLSYTDLSRADLCRADLIMASLVGADLERANFLEADLREADLRGADLRGATLREANLILADFTGADLTNVTFTGANLAGAILRETNLSTSELFSVKLNGTDLSGSDLSGVDLRKALNVGTARLTAANLSGALLSSLDLNGAQLTEANLSWADLSGVKLNDANLEGADLSGANLGGADLRGAYLCKALLSKANLAEAILSSAHCEGADFSKANLTEARLINAHLDGATLNGARLWEVQRGGWSIKGVICTNAYWDKEGKESTVFAPGEFERLYAEKIKVVVKYPNGITPLEIVTLPALIQHLEASTPGCKLRFESIQDAPGGALVTIVVEDVENTSLEQLERLKADIQSEAEQKSQLLREALEDERRTRLLLTGEVQALERIVDKVLSREKTAIYLEKGGITMSEFKNTIQGNFQGAMGDGARATNLSYNQIGDRIQNSMDLLELAGDLVKLRQAMSEEAKEPAHYISLGEVAKAEEAATAKDSSKVAEGLKGAGKWALDVATKIGASLATEAIKESMGMK